MSNPPSPLVAHSKVSLIQTISGQQLIDDWLRTFNINISKEISKDLKIHLYKCEQTKLYFFIPFNLEGSGSLYEQLQKFDWYYMPNKWEHDVALQDLKGCSKVLEIGSAFGDFVKKAIDCGLDIQGVELNEKAVAVAKSENLPVDSNDLNDLAESHVNQFDGVCSFQVLEHVAHPQEFINASLKVLKPGGTLIYCVPNSESFLKHQYNLLDMPPHHMTRWSKSTFQALEKIFPIRLEKVKFEPLAPYHISAFLDSYSRHLRSLSSGYKVIFNRLSLPLYRRSLTLGARYFFRGQSLYVKFRKLS